MIYLDHNATTPVFPDVLTAMMPFFSTEFGNPSNTTHAMGWKAAEAVENAREQILRDLKAGPEATLIFTSGTTESNNFILKSVLSQLAKRPIHIITQKTEHESVLQPCQYLRSYGANVTELNVDEFGRVEPNDLKAALKPETVLVSIMHANNETGTLQNIRELAKVVHEHSSALFHSDCAQTLGKIPFDAQELGVDFITLSAHKLYGPKGVGAALCCSKAAADFLQPLLHGGSHENGFRSGTLNVPGIVGFAKAVELVSKDVEQEALRLCLLRDRLAHALQSQINEIYFNGHVTERLPNTLNVSFRFVESGKLLLKFPHIALSSGSACSTGKVKSSSVILAMTQNEERAKTSIRFSLGRTTSEIEIDQTVEMVAKAVQTLRSKSLEYEMFKGG